LEYIQACFDEELQTAEKQQEEERRTLRQKIERDIKEKISQLQEEIVANELSEGMKSLITCLVVKPSYIVEGWGSPHRKRRRLEFSQPEKRKKPSSVSDILTISLFLSLFIVHICVNFLNP